MDRIRVSSTLSEATDEKISEKKHQKQNPKQDLHVRFTDVVTQCSELYCISSHIEPENGAKPFSSHPAAYNRLMKSFSRVGKVDEVLRLFFEMKEARCNPNVLCYNTVLNCLAKSRHFKAVSAVFGQMVTWGITPTVSTYNILVKVYSCYSDQFEEAFKILDQMSKNECSPDVTTYSALIMGLSRAGRFEDANSVLIGMLDENCSPNIYTFTPILQGLCAQGKVEDAKVLIESMGSDCPPNSVTYNILIDALCNLGNFDEVESIFKDSVSKGWKPNAISYNIYMNGLCKAGMVEEASRQLEVMMGEKLHLTTMTLGTLIDCLCHASKVYEARDLLDQSFDLGWDVSFVSYNTVMKSFCNIGAWLIVLKLFTDMFKKGVVPNTRTCNIVVNSLCKAGKLRIAKCLVDSRGFAADVVTYNTLINGFYKVRDISEVQHLYNRMTTIEKINPDMFTYTILIEMLCSEGKVPNAICLFLEGLRQGFSLDLVAYSAIINGCLKNERLGEGLQLLDRMLEQGLVPNVAVYDSLLRAYCRNGFCCSRKISHVCAIIDKMLGKR